MTFKEQLTSDLTVFFNVDDFAETVTYTPVSGNASQITAIITRDDVHQEPYKRGESFASCLIYIKKSDVSNLQWGDIFTFDSSDWELSDDGESYQDDDIREITLRRIET